MPIVVVGNGSIGEFGDFLHTTKCDEYQLIKAPLRSIMSFSFVLNYRLPGEKSHQE
jgi:hypothetical protein